MSCVHAVVCYSLFDCEIMEVFSTAEIAEEYCTLLNSERNERAIEDDIEFSVQSWRVFEKLEDLVDE